MLIFFLLIIFFLNIEAKTFNYYKFEDKTKEFKTCDMNTAILTILTDEKILFFSIISKFRNIREPMFISEVDFKGGLQVKVIEYYSFIFTKEDISVFRFRNGKIEFLKKIEEKDAIQIEKSYLNQNNPVYYIFKDNKILIYSDFFNKIKEENFEKKLKFISSDQDESLYKYKENEYLIFEFDPSYNLHKKDIIINEDILYFSGKGMYITKDNNENLTIYNNFEVRKKINPYKDLKKSSIKEDILRFKVNKVLPMWEKFCIIGEIVYKDKPAEKRTLVYDDNYRFCKVEGPFFAEIFSVDAKENSFSDIIFLAKHLFYYFQHGSYYSCFNF